MTENHGLLPAIYAGWHTYQEMTIAALRPLSEDQLALRAGLQLRSVDEIARHIIGARAGWFYNLMGEGGDEFQALGKWDRRGARIRSAQELINGLERTWQGMQTAIASWSPEDWRKTWSGEDEGEPEVITRPWVIWHLIEHDLPHTGNAWNLRVWTLVRYWHRPEGFAATNILLPHCRVPSEIESSWRVRSAFKRQS